MKILVLNSGRSSLKYQVIDMETEETLAKNKIRKSSKRPFRSIKICNGSIIK